MTRMPRTKPSSKAMPRRRTGVDRTSSSTRRTHRQGATSSRSMRRSHTRTTMVKSGFNDTDGRWSPDGTWLAYVSDESGRPDIYANPREGNRVRVSFGGGTRPRWSRDGHSIFFLRGSTIMRATLTNSSPASFAPAVPRARCSWHQRLRHRASARRPAGDRACRPIIFRSGLGDGGLAVGFHENQSTTVSR